MAKPEAKKTRDETTIEKHRRLALQYKKAGPLYKDQAEKHLRKFNLELTRETT